MSGLTYVGVPIDSVGRRGGTEHGPDALRELGLVAALGGRDAGDLDVRIRGERRDPETGIVASEDVLATTRALRAAVRELIRAGERPFLAGGCCTEVVGALAGARDALGRVGLAYLDGHLDLYDGRTSPTGEAADMPIAVALGHGPDRWVEAAGGSSLRPGDTALIGHRDQEESRRYDSIQPEELPGLTYPSVDEVRRDPRSSGAYVAEHLGSRIPFWVHLDVDVLDQEVFAATDYLMPGGLTWAELGATMSPLFRSGRLIGASLGCYNPDKDPGRACGRGLVDALGDAIGT
jgi:arginase